MELKKWRVEDLIPYENNPRINDGAVDAVAESIRQCGYVAPIIVDEDGVILAGHTRRLALQRLGIADADVIVRAGLTEDQKRKYRILDNKTNEFAEWDFSKLEEELADLDFGDFDFGFDETSEDCYGNEENGSNNKDQAHASLSKKFGVPPFSVFDTRKGYWQERKKYWKEIGLNSGEGRDAEAIDSSFGESYGRTPVSGVSIFDPVLTEISYKWFNIHKGKIFDCFAGGSVRGVVADYLGYDYTGIDLRKEQVEANYKNANEIGVSPLWICDDSLNADKYIADESVDMIFSCPPYADLEVYSDDPRDISNMSYDDFIEAYRKIIEIACRKLKKNRFAVFVVGDIRDKKGFYRNFVDDTKKAFNECGCSTYNEIILLDMLGTAMLRANKQFKSRKVVKTHQNVLVFFKGDPSTIKEVFPEIEHTWEDDEVE